MKFLTLLLVAFGAMFLISTAQAAVVTPEKQATLSQQGWHVVDDEADGVQAKIPGRCDYGGRVKSIGSQIRDATNTLQVRGRLRGAFCAHNGEITYARFDYYHASPGGRWRHLYGPWLNRGPKGCWSQKGWVFGGVIDQDWVLRLNLQAEANGNNVWFPEKFRKWS